MKIQTMTAAALLLSACSTTEYVFTPPETAEGKACVERCQASQMACRRDQDRRAEAAAEQCELESARREEQCKIKAPIEYAACLKFAKNDEERAACQLNECSQASCGRSGDYGLCANDYRVCFQSCGGKIGVIER